MFIINQGVTLEAKYALPKYDRSLFFEEKEPNEEYGAIKSVLGTELDGIGISPAPFDRNNVYKVAHSVYLSDYIDHLKNMRLNLAIFD